VSLLLWNLLLAIVWTFLTGTVNASNLAIGFVLGYLMLWALRPALGRATYFRRTPKAVVFVGFFLWEVLMASVRVAYDIVTPRHHNRPGIVAVPIDDMTDEEITLLSNVIGLTPGSLVLDVSSDRKTLYVHVMFVETPEKARRVIRDQLARRLLEVIR
jgi:multicomponent Na+:H+ antiporter subunit E